MPKWAQPLKGQSGKTCKIIFLLFLFILHFSWTHCKRTLFCYSFFIHFFQQRVCSDHATIRAGFWACPGKRPIGGAEPRKVKANRSRRIRAQTTHKAKCSQVHNAYSVFFWIVFWSPLLSIAIAIGWGARENQESLLQSSISPTGLSVPSIVFWSPL